MKPLVLLSNDDGIGSANLHALADAIEHAQLAEVLIVAPERERSAASHTITLHKPLRLHDHGNNRFALSGTPVDCVYLGVIELAPRPVDLVLSGINRGFNLGSDVFYSGTVAAAVEGGLRNIPSIAFSIDPAKDRDLDAALGFCVALVERVLAEGLPERTILNVNLPAHTDARYAWTRLGNRVYQDDVTQRSDPRGRAYYWIGGGLAEMDHGPDTDCHAVANGIVSVTPLHLDLTSHEILAAKRIWHVDGYECLDPLGSPT